MEDKCENCKWLKKVMCHPQNVNYLFGDPIPDRFSHGSIRKQLGFVCTLPLMPNFLFFNTDQGLCECHEKIEI